jgi:fido (protein-threonine AMPylation protein)
MGVRHRSGGQEWYPLDELEVVHHNIVGMRRDDDDNSVEQCLLAVRTVEEINFAAAERMRQAVDFVLDLPSDTRLDCDLILDLHDRVFGELFRWGGRYRRCSDIVVGKQEFETPDAQVVPMLMMQFESDVQTIAKRLSGALAPQQTIYWRELARVYFRFCEIHPFRDCYEPPYLMS